MFNENEFNTAKFNAELLALLTADETISMADPREMMLSMDLTESQFLQDNETNREIQKGFDDELRLSAWLTVKRVNPADWSD
jgi:hypothetical protein